ncbi:integral membrane protein [Histoplasma capsulatum var. duboisii H88]|uniref:Integral membrane protein n=2 Tax=Ajellomyces capsulatus (strain H88) TaxID=544711 RepID=F0URF0_AJEC8|nr:integral membrane protein [Histoplasma capsulatum var. duboisii H88]
MEGLPPPSKAPPFPIVTADQRSVLGVAIAFAIIPALAVMLRMLARHVANRSLDASDYCIIVACIFAVALESVSITGVIQCGIGYGHTVQVIQEYGLEPITKLLKLLIPLQFLWVLSLSFCKVSILMLYAKVFPVATVIWVGRGAMVFIAAWAIATIVAGCVICRPFAFNWDQTIPGGKCGDQVLSFTITGVFNLVTDILVLCLPLPYLAKLQMQLYKKLVLIGVFSIGLLTCVVSAVRIHTLSSMDFADITYSIPPANIFSGLEPSVAVTLSCIPLLRPLLRRPKYGSGSNTSYPANSTGASKNNGPGGGGGFEQLNDNSSQYQLRPVAGKHFAAVSSSKTPASSGHDSSDLESNEVGGITVHEHWHVATER